MTGRCDLSVMCPESSVHISSPESQLHLQYSDRNNWIFSDVSRILCPDFLTRITVTPTIQWQVDVTCQWCIKNPLSRFTHSWITVTPTIQWHKDVTFQWYVQNPLSRFSQQNDSYTYREIDSQKWHVSDLLRHISRIMNGA